ncbi:AaceriAGL197Wp [[Ashbya] aceris (nom. inval.)]|nr:AaceriAGL197Wp [[Ashbya] aceris (nom. inval.)]
MAGEPWSIDPTALLHTHGNRGGDNANERQGERVSLNLDYAAKDAVGELGLAVEAEAGYFELGTENYEDIDEFLTQELRDLDIPVAPVPGGGVGLVEPPACYPKRPEEEEDSIFANALDWAALEHVGSDSRTEPEQCVDRRTGRRTPSGTAIFGFSKHNKTLNIGAGGIAGDDLDRSELLNSKEKQSLPAMSSLIIKQQEELGLALERQKEMNRQLEEQLKINQLQQKQLQAVLNQQESAGRKLGGNTSVMTPLHHPQEYDSVLLASSSRSGGYTFPVLSEEEEDDDEEPPDTVLTGSRATLNGSPRKQYLPVQEASALDTLGAASPRGTAMDKLPPKTVPPISIERPLKLFPTGVQQQQHLQQQQQQKQQHGKQACLIRQTFSVGSMDSGLGDQSPLSPRHQLVASSPKLAYESSVTPVLHRNSKSLSSTPSTVFPPADPESELSITSGKLQRPTTIGLGLHYHDSQQPPIQTTNRPVSMGMLPSYKSNAFGGKESLSPPGYPQKYRFQQTPIRDSPQRVVPMGSARSSGSYPMNPNLFEMMKSPQLRPPGGAYYTHCRTRSDSTEYAEDRVPEFVHAKSPSPILLSQEKFDKTHQFHALSGTLGGAMSGAGCKKVFDGQRPPGQYLGQSSIYSPERSSPMKKASNLPQGEIDQYIKKLQDKTFQCLYPECGKLFNRRYNIRSHIQTHLEDRPFRCDHEGCTKAFVRNHDLIRHKKTHAEKTFTCPCGKKFSREDALLTHRTRMICVGGKKFDNIVIKKSPRKRGRPKKEGTSANNSPVKDVLARDYSGTVTLKMEKQLQKEPINSDLLQVPGSTPKAKITMTPVALRGFITSP